MVQVMEIRRRVPTRAPVGATFDYLSDFTSTEEWDPGTVRTTLRHGDGGVGTTYDNVSRFLGRETRLTYVVREYDAGSRIVLRGENATVVTHDSMTLSARPDGGTDVDYRATFAFKGWTRIVAPLLSPAFKRLGDKAEARLRQALDRLAS